MEKDHKLLCVGKYPICIKCPPFLTFFFLIYPTKQVNYKVLKLKSEKLFTFVIAEQSDWTRKKLPLQSIIHATQPEGWLCVKMFGGGCTQRNAMPHPFNTQNTNTRQLHCTTPNYTLQFNMSQDGCTIHGRQTGRQMWPLRNFFCSFYPFELEVSRVVKLCIPNNRMFFFGFSILTVFGGKMRSQDWQQNLNFN